MAYDDPYTRELIRQGRRKFAAMVATYGMGTFNDSFYRQSAMLLAVAAGRGHVQGWIMSMFALPYLLFASPAGWLADRFSKRRIVIAAKMLELVAMLCGAYGILTLSWPFVLAMVFTMGLQSCMFSPALNGSIPELYPAAYVTRANATLKVVVTVTILGGVAASGVALDREGAGWFAADAGRTLVATGAVSIALTGVALSFGVPRRIAADPNAPFPWTGPWNTAKRLLELRRDSLLAKVVATNVYIWFAGALVIPLINSMAVEEFGWGKAVGGYLIAVQMSGLAVGGIVVSRFKPGPRWRQVLAPALLGMAAALLALNVLPHMPVRWRLGACFGLLGVAGFFGGLVMIPCEAFIQVRPDAGRKGATIAAVNFAVFAGILISGPIAGLCLWVLPPTRSLAVVGAVSVPVGMLVRWAMHREVSGQ